MRTGMAQGIPDGFRGTAIPIGARILSVVDCFDALTSDRPYRPRISDDDAIKILLSRRGQIYDPLSWTRSLQIHQEIAPDGLSAQGSNKGLAITRACRRKRWLAK